MYAGFAFEDIIFFGSVSNYLCLERSAGQASQPSLSAGFNCCWGGALQPRVVHLQRKYHPVQMLKSALSAQKTLSQCMKNQEKSSADFSLCVVELKGETQSFQCGSDYPLAKS